MRARRGARQLYGAVAFAHGIKAAIDHNAKSVKYAITSMERFDPERDMAKVDTSRLSADDLRRVRPTISAASRYGVLR